MLDLPSAVERILRPQGENKQLLKFLTCGSVDDGKSSLIGRLLYDSKLIFEDQLSAIERDSRRHGTAGDDVDLALLVDGLEAEREQGITIDVAYRYFTTPQRAFIVADTPGHEQYTRNMATGASTADLAIILVDARKGILTQTKRHSYICSLLGIRSVVLAVNKMDLVDFSGELFYKIVSDYVGFAKALGFLTICPIPLSARFGDNVTNSFGPNPVVRWADTVAASRSRRTSLTISPPNRSASRSSGSIAQTSTFAASPERLRQDGSRLATMWWLPRRAPWRRSRASLHSMAIGNLRCPAMLLP